MPYLQAVQQESMRIGYLSIDAAGRSGAGNPLTNLKVRQAIWHAVNRQEMADKLVQGGSRVPIAPCFPTQFGCDADAAVKYAYDPAKAKALLAEAGFPNGFETEFLTSVQPTSWRGAAPLYHQSWGSYSINDVSAIFPVMYGKDANDNYSRDPELEKLVAEGGAANDKESRKKAYSAAIKLMTEKAYWLPLFTYVNTYAFAKQLDFKTYPDELPRFYFAKW